MLWTLAVVPALCLLLLIALALGGWWVESRFLQREIRFGENDASSVHAYGARFEWTRLNFRADSVWFRSPLLDARTGATEVRIDWLGGLSALLSLRAAARLDADSVYLRLRADTTEPEEKPLDSLAFPDFAVPLVVRVDLRGVRIDDDSGFLARARDVHVRSRNKRKARARIDSAQTRWTKNLLLHATAALDWSKKDSIDLEARVLRGPDTVSLKGRHAMRPLWKGREEVDARIRETGIYARTFGIDSLPNVRDIRLHAVAALSESPALDLKLNAAVAAHRLSDEFTLSPQTVDLSARWKNRRGGFSLQSKGEKGEDVVLSGEGRLLDLPARRDTSDATPPWERAAVSLRGHARNFRVRVQDTLRSADVVIEKADWDGRRLAVKLQTGDASRLEASGSMADSRWNASFLLDVNPGERWLHVFTGSNVSFAQLRAQGTAAGGGKKRGAKGSAGGAVTAQATLSARKISAYGVRLDSLHSSHAYGPQGYELKPSQLYSGKDVWTLSGRVLPAAPAGKKKGAGGTGSALAFELSHPTHGKLGYALNADGSMEVKASLLEVDALPYALTDSLPIEDPLLDGIFVWNPGRKTGSADLSAQAQFKQQHLEARVSGKWDARLLNLTTASIKMRKSELTVEARMRMNGRQFYEAWQVKPAQYEYAAIRTPGFDIAEALKLFQPEPALSKGSVSGEMSYGETSGFEGQLKFASITPTDAIGDVVLKQLDLEGMGDTLFVSARTTSETVKPLNASLRIGVNALLQDEQKIRVSLTAGDSLRVQMEATSRQFQSLRGTLRAAGSIALPEKSGTVEKIDVDMAFDVPLVDPVNRSLLATRLFRGVYVLPGLTRQRFSLDPALRDGVFRMNNFSLQNEQGQTLTGTMEYALARNSLKAHLGGERFAAQWADDYSIDLRNLSFDLARGENGLHLDASFARANFLYVDAPLHARGTLSSARIAYDEPARPAGSTGRQRHEQAPAVLTLSGSLSESLIRYRLKSFADLQKVFRKERQKKSSGPPLRLNVKVQTLGNKNQIDSDILRLTWVGDLSIRGVHPYTLFNGRINSLDGGLGLDKQAYGIQRFEVKWLNAPVDEGRINMEARKELASDCNRRDESEVDSCTAIMRLQGELNDMQFSYDTDCGGSYGAGASVAAILYSVQRGCYDASLATGDGGAGYGSKALDILAPTLSRGLSGYVSRYSRNWIEYTEITGLGSAVADEPTGDTLGEALSLGLTSKEYMRLRLKVRSGRHIASQDLSNPWEHMLALEWRPPADYLFRSDAWQRRMRDNLRAVASLQTRPVKVNSPEEDEIEKKVGLNYTYFFWGNWWSKPRKPEENVTPPLRPAQTSGEPAK
jgi:hypothetical protein